MSNSDDGVHIKHNISINESPQVKRVGRAHSQSGVQKIQL